MEWYDLILLLIDMRSFSSLWYWVALAVLWSSANHWVIGVPYDLIRRARSQGGVARQDVALLAQINARRMLYVSRAGGAWMIGVSCFIMTVLALLAIYYRVEFAQAVLLMAAPMALVGYLSLRVALRIEAQQPEGRDLLNILGWHRFWVQLIGMVSIFVTALFGMYHNIT